MDIPEVQSVVDKLAHKKFFMVLTLQYICWQIGVSGIVPEKWWWVPLVCATVATLAAIGCQTYLDREPKTVEGE